MRPGSWGCPPRAARSPWSRALGESAERISLAEVEQWAMRRGEVVVIASGQPHTASLLREHIPRWEAQGFRLVPVSEVVR